MNCGKTKKLIPDYLVSGLDSKTILLFEKHISECQDCNRELGNLSSIWMKLGNVPQEEPGPILKTQFYSMLEKAEKEEFQKKVSKISVTEKIDEWISVWWPKKQVYQLCVSLILLIIGFCLGQIKILNFDNTEISNDKENYEKRNLVINSINNEFSSIERINGLVKSQNINNPDNYLLSTILYKLNTDPDVNVRLMSVDTLQQYSSNTWIKNELIKSLEQQSSPLVQIALIEMLVEMKDKRIANILVSIIKNPDTNIKVKKIASWGIQKVI